MVRHPDIARWMDPTEHTVLIVMPQRMPFNVEEFLTGAADVYYSSFDD